MSDPTPSLPDLIAQCLSRLEHEGEAGLDAMCAEHPSRADALRRRIGALRDTGMIAAADKTPRTLGDGEFVLLDVVAGGGMGVVWRAEQRPLGRIVAVKIVRPGQLLVAGARERFEREVETVARLQHPGIVSILTVGHDDGLPWYAMDYVPGCSLGDVLAGLRDREPSSLSSHDLSATIERYVAGDEAQEATVDDAHARPTWLAESSWQLAVARVVCDLAEALEHAHARGVIHRDVKPSNVLITPEGDVRLTDFGLARLDENEGLSRTGQQIGTPYAMSPEQIEGVRGTIGPATDVYGAGVVLYQLLTLTPPFAGETTEALFARILAGDAPDPRRWVPNLSRDLAAIALRALERSPSDRYARAADLSDDLRRVLDGHTPRARPLSSTRRIMRRLLRQSLAARWLDSALTVSLALGLDVLLLQPFAATEPLVGHGLRALVATLATLTAAWFLAPRPATPRTKGFGAAGIVLALALVGTTIQSDHDHDRRRLDRQHLQHAVAAQPRAALRPLDAFLTTWRGDLDDDDRALAARIQLLNQRPDRALRWANELDDSVERDAIACVALEQLGQLDEADRAEARWRVALETQQADVDWLRLGAIFADARRYEDALEAYAIVGRTPALRGERDLLHRRVAVVQAELERWDEARTAVEALLPWYPDDEEVIALDARIAIGENDWGRAELALERLASSTRLLHASLRHELLAGRDGPAAAAAWVREVAARESLDDELLDWLAHRALTERRVDDAYALFERLAVQASSDYARTAAAIGLSSVALQRGEHDLAERHARAGIAVGLPLHEGPFDLAQIELRRALDESLGDVDRLAAADWTTIAAHLEDARALNPIHVSTVNNLAYARLRLGDHAAARALLEPRIAALERQLTRALPAENDIALRTALSMCLDTSVDAWLADEDSARALAAAQRALDVLPASHPSRTKRTLRLQELRTAITRDG